MIPLGTLQRLSGHEHFEREPGQYLPELVEKSIEACTYCKAITTAWDEGVIAGREEERDAHDRPDWEE